MGTSELIHLSAQLGLSRAELQVSPSGGGGLRVKELEVDPYQFLEQAEDDFAQGGQCALLNAIANAKRSITSQMDQALLTFGYSPLRWNIPRKLKTLDELGIAAPRILRKVSAARNLLEHEYKRPSDGEIEDALDLATLFLGAVKPKLLMFGDEFYIGNEADRLDAFHFTRELSFSMSMAEAPATFRVWAVERSAPESRPQKIGETTIDAKDSVFAKLVRVAFAIDVDFRLNEAIDALASELCP